MLFSRLHRWHQAAVDLDVPESYNVRVYRRYVAPSMRVLTARYYLPLPSREASAGMAFTPISGDDVLFDHPLPWFSQAERDHEAGPDELEDDEFEDEDDEFDDEFDEDDEFDDEFDDEDEEFDDIDEEEEEEE